MSMSRKRLKKAPTFQEKLNTFVHWITEINGDIWNLKFSASKDEFGNNCVRTTARRNIPLGSEIISISNSLVICRDTVTPSLSKLVSYNRLNELPTTSLLSLFLILCRYTNFDLPFRPYVDILPENYRALPYNWPETTWDKVHSPTLRRIAKERKALILKDYEEDLQLLRLCGNKRMMEAFTQCRYLWARSVLMSRSFHSRLVRPVECSEHPTDPCLLPMLDLLDHDPSARVDWIPSSDRIYFLEARSSIAEGQVVMNNYGKKTNEELLLGYGFALEHNPNFHLSLQSNLGIIQLDSKQHYVETCHQATVQVLSGLQLLQDVGKFPEENWRNLLTRGHIPSFKAYREALKMLIDEVTKLSRSRDSADVPASLKDRFYGNLSMAVNDKNQTIDTVMAQLEAGFDCLCMTVSEMWTRYSRPRTLGRAPWSIEYQPLRFPASPVACLFPSGWIDAEQALAYLDDVCDSTLLRKILDSVQMLSPGESDEVDNEFLQVLKCALALTVASYNGEVKLSTYWDMLAEQLDEEDLFFSMDFGSLAELVDERSKPLCVRSFLQILNFAMETSVYEDERKEQDSHVYISLV